MGVVFFVMLLFIAICIALGLFGITLVLFIIYFVLKHNQKKVKGLKIAAIIMLVISVISSILPLGCVVFFTFMYHTAFPTIGPVIDQITFQDEEFTVDGEKYVALDYDSNIYFDSEYTEAVFTYQMYVLFFRLNTDYYYELSDPNLDFNLYFCSNSILFCKESDYDEVTEYYNNIERNWLVNKGITITDSDDITLLNQLLDLQGDIESIDSDNVITFHDFDLISADTYVMYDSLDIYQINDGFYLYKDYTFDEENGTTYSVIQIPDDVASIIEDIVNTKLN